MKEKTTIRKAKRCDAKIFADLSSKLYKADKDQMALEFEGFLNDKHCMIAFAEIDKVPVAFVQIQIRKDYVEGCETNFVGYLEGLFVEKKHRRKGVGKSLVEYGVSWAKQKGCKEFASDCEFSNKTARVFHNATNFAEINKIVCFKYKL